MRTRDPTHMPSWALPLVVAALVLPAVLGFRIAGPPLGVGLGALSVAAVVLLAVNMRWEEPIEVAASPGDRYRVLLVLAAEPLDRPLAAGALAAIAEHGAPEGGGAAEPEVLVLAPAVGPPLARWLSDVGEARLAAQERLAVSLGTLAAAGLDAHGRVGDPDVTLAIEDTLRTFPAHELVFASADPAAVEDVSRRLDRPVRTLPAA